jgi:hypothetical protein
LSPTASSRPPSGGEGLDEWLLDTTTRRWQQLPDMPADVALKFTTMSWTGDSRLVFLAQTADLGHIVAVWRPGQPWIARRQVQPPKRSGGRTALRCGERAARTGIWQSSMRPPAQILLSDTFLPLPTGCPHR